MTAILGFATILGAVLWCLLVVLLCLALAFVFSPALAWRERVITLALAASVLGAMIAFSSATNVESQPRHTYPQEY